MFRFLISMSFLFLIYSCNTTIYRPQLRVLNKINDTIDIKDSILFQVEISNINNKNIVISAAEYGCGCIEKKSNLPIVIKPMQKDTFNMIYKPFITNDSAMIIKSVSLMTNADTSISIFSFKYFIKH